MRNIHPENCKRKYLNSDYCFDLSLTIMLLFIGKKTPLQSHFVKKTGTQTCTIKYQLQTK